MKALASQPNLADLVTQAVPDEITAGRLGPGEHEHEHQQILDAIGAGAGARAEDLARRHITEASAYMVARLHGVAKAGSSA